MSPSWCMCEPLETAQSLGDDTCGGAHGQSGHESTGYTQSVESLGVGGLQAWPIDRCSRQGRGLT